VTDRPEGRPHPASAADPAADALPGAVRGLEGTTWTVARYAIGGALVHVPAGVHADAVFAAGRVSGSAGCNRYTGGCTASGSALSVGPLATTMKACPPPASEVEAVYLAALATVASYAQTIDRLTLFDASGAVVIEYVAVPRDAYLGSWTARMVNNGRQAVTSLRQAARSRWSWTTTAAHPAARRATGTWVRTR
jgi:hypothetical protein